MFIKCTRNSLTLLLTWNYPLDFGRIKYNTKTSDSLFKFISLIKKSSFSRNQILMSKLFFLFKKVVIENPEIEIGFFFFTIPYIFCNCSGGIK